MPGQSPAQPIAGQAKLDAAQVDGPSLRLPSGSLASCTSASCHPSTDPSCSLNRCPPCRLAFLRRALLCVSLILAATARVDPADASLRTTRSQLLLVPAEPGPLPIVRPPARSLAQARPTDVDPSASRSSTGQHALGRDPNDGLQVGLLPAPPGQGWRLPATLVKLMLRPPVRSLPARTSQRKAIVGNSVPSFAGKTVMDVGAGNGILSFFAVEVRPHPRCFLAGSCCSRRRDQPTTRARRVVQLTRFRAPL